MSSKNPGPPGEVPIMRTASGAEHYLLEDPSMVVGIFPDIIRSLSQALNFSTTFYQRLDGDYGHLEGNGSFTGIIGSLIKARHY